MKGLNPQKRIFQSVPIKDKVVNPYKNNIFKEINRSRNCVNSKKLNSANVLEIVKCGSVALEVFGGFIGHNMQFTPYAEFVNYMIAKRDRYEKQRKHLLQTLAKRIANSVYGGNIRRDVSEQHIRVTGNSMKEIYDDRIKEWWP